jgi:hypothetical protein
MFSKLAAILMALVIANPACCCVFGCGNGSDEEPIHSCCSGSSSSDENDSEDEEKGCQCFSKKKASSETNIVFLAGKTSPPIPSPPALAEDRLELLPNISVAVQFVSKWPPGHLAPPPLTRRLALHGCYLL